LEEESYQHGGETRKKQENKSCQVVTQQVLYTKYMYHILSEKGTEKEKLALMHD